MHCGNVDRTISTVQRKVLRVAQESIVSRARIQIGPLDLQFNHCCVLLKLTGNCQCQLHLPNQWWNLWPSGWICIRVVWIFLMRPFQLQDQNLKQSLAFVSDWIAKCCFVKYFHGVMVPFCFRPMLRGMDKVSRRKRRKHPQKTVHCQLKATTLQETTKSPPMQEGKKTVTLLNASQIWTH